MLAIQLIFPIISIFNIYILKNKKSIQQIALGYSIQSQIQSQIIKILFDNNTSLFQFQFFNFFAIDGLSLWLILLINIQMPIVILSVYKSSDKNQKIQIIFIGFWSVAVFIVKNIILFYISFEGVQIPLYFQITQYGSRNRKVHASYMFFIYTLFGSLFQFFAQIGLYIENGTGNYEIQLTQNFNLPHEYFLWFAFFICFAIKQPIVGFHTWLLAAHVESPTAGSVILAAILQKMGSYGQIRYSISLFPTATIYFRPFIMIICIISILYSALAALSQSDMKLIIAYSSVSHMGTATIGLFSNDIKP